MYSDVKIIVLFVAIAIISPSLYGAATESGPEVLRGAVPPVPYISDEEADFFFGDEDFKGLERAKAIDGFEAFRRTVPTTGVPGKAEYLYAIHLNKLTGVDQNIRGVIIDFIGKAANKKYAIAQYAYSDILFYGKGVQRDVERALEFLKLSADGGYAGAQYRYGEVLFSGKIGVQRNVKRAVELWKLAAEAGSADAKYRYGIELLFGKKGIAQSIPDAIHFLGDAKQKEHGAAKEMFFVANHIHADRLYTGSNGVVKDPEAAEKYYKEAADGGVPEAQFQYSKLLLRRGDSHGSEKYLRFAADGGVPEAQFQYGEMLVSDGDPKGYDYIERAAAQGHAAASEYLEEMDGGSASYEDGSAASEYLEEMDDCGSASSEDESASPASAAAATAGTKRRRGDR